MKETSLPLSQILRKEIIDKGIVDIVAILQDIHTPMQLAKVDKYVHNCEQWGVGGDVQVVIDRTKPSVIKITVKPRTKKP